jgi:putative FmdB family regulatory protein
VVRVLINELLSAIIVSEEERGLPVYEYKCENCSCRFELKQSFNDNSAVTCPQCRSSTKRVFSPVPIIFKGSGFYVTDKAAEEGKGPASRRDGDRPADVERSTELTKEDKEEVAS